MKKPGIVTLADVSVREIVSAVFRAVMFVHCPLCEADKHEACLTRSGHPRRKPHDRRIDLARESGFWGIGEPR
jgi:hypothetical protein